MTDTEPRKRGRPANVDKHVRMHVYIREADAQWIRDYAAARELTVGEVISRLVYGAH